MYFVVLHHYFHPCGDTSLCPLMKVQSHKANNWSSKGESAILISFMVYWYNTAQVSCWAVDNVVLKLLLLMSLLLLKNEHCQDVNKALLFQSAPILTSFCMWVCVYIWGPEVWSSALLCACIICLISAWQTKKKGVEGWISNAIFILGCLLFWRFRIFPRSWGMYTWVLFSNRLLSYSRYIVQSHQIVCSVFLSCCFGSCIPDILAALINFLSLQLFWGSALNTCRKTRRIVITKQYWEFNNRIKVLLFIIMKNDGVYSMFHQRIAY